MDSRVAQPIPVYESNPNREDYPGVLIIGGTQRFRMPILIQGRNSLDAAFEQRKTQVQHFDPQINLAGVTLSPAIDAKLRNLKKYRPEAFFYWSQVDMLLK